MLCCDARNDMTFYVLCDLLSPSRLELAEVEAQLLLLSQLPVQALMQPQVSKETMCLPKSKLVLDQLMVIYQLGPERLLL